MSHQLDKILEDNLTPEELDAILEKAIQAKFDAELKLDMEKTLREEYSVSKQKRGGAFTGRAKRNFLYYIAAAAASIGFLILALTVFDPFSGDAQQLASSYLASSEIYHSGAVKGSARNEDIRMQAVQAFNTKKYAEAEQYFSQIEEKTEEDLFYSGISALYADHYQEAIGQLALVARSESNFQTEANWYLAIAYILHGEEATARNLLSPLKDSSWNQEKTRKLLKALK